MALPPMSRGEAPSSGRSVEAPTAARGSGHLGSSELMEKVVSRPNLKAALKRVRKNKGGPGIDGMTVEELLPYLRVNWLRIREDLLAGTYQPSPVKRQPIPKSGGGVRGARIPAVLDRLIQHGPLPGLSPGFGVGFSEHSYGFPPWRNAPQAVEGARPC